MESYNGDVHIEGTNVASRRQTVQVGRHGLRELTSLMMRRLLFESLLLQRRYSY